YIDHVIHDDLGFYFRGAGWDYCCIEEVFPMLESHGIEFFSLTRYVEEQYRDDDTGETVAVTEDLEEDSKYGHADYIEGLVMDNLPSMLTTEVFTLLFSDREAMKKFN